MEKNLELLAATIYKEHITKKQDTLATIKDTIIRAIEMHKYTEAVKFSQVPALFRKQL